MRVVVITGSRDWADPEPIRAVLRGADFAILGCARGADAIAREVCVAWDIQAEVHRARWRELGNVAGHERNERMVKAAADMRERGFDVHCFAFPRHDSSGTWDCVRQLKNAGFAIQFPPEQRRVQPGLESRAKGGISRVAGDLLQARVDALVNPVNTVGAMGKGLALAFKQAFPENYAAYAGACRDARLKPGQVFVTERDATPRVILNVATKADWREPSRLQYVRDGLDNIVERVHALQVRSIAIPALGCGEGGLPWNEVKPLLEAAAAQMPNVRVRLFAPHRAIEQVPTARGRGFDIDR